MTCCSVPGGGHDVGSWCQSWRRWGQLGLSRERGLPAAAASVQSPTQAHTHTNARFIEILSGNVLKSNCEISHVQNLLQLQTVVRCFLIALVLTCH